MPTDALTYNANLLAPAAPSTNFFDPTATQSVLARYANTRIANEGSQAVAQAASRLAASRMQRIEDARKQKLWDREEQAWNEKQDAKAQRGQFLEAFGRIDPNAEDYESQMDELRKTMPPELFKDDAILDMKAAKDRIFYTNMQRRERDLDQKDREAEWKRRNIEAMQNRAAEMGAPKEVYEGSFDEDGVFNPMKFHEGVGEWKRGLAEAEARKEAQKEVKGAVKDTLSTMEERAKQDVMDERAFSRALPAVFENAKDKEGKPLSATTVAELVRPEDIAAYHRAKALDDKRFEYEMSVARNYKNPMDYLKAGESTDPAKPKLTDAEKQKRLNLWYAANAGGGIPAAETPKPGTPAPEVSRKPLTRELMADYMFRAKNDRKKAAEMAEKDGYSVN
jgi:hypothetical protein